MTISGQAGEATQDLLAPVGDPSFGTGALAGGAATLPGPKRAPRNPLIIPEGRRHILTIALEDYYHVRNFDSLIQREHWHRFETRVERSTRRALDLLDEFGIKATFFALGWVADTLPEVIREVADRGHEIASKGYNQRGIRELSEGAFREDLARSREALERASGRRVVGYRASGWFTAADLWALRVLAEEGYEYDSSLKPLGYALDGDRLRRFAHPNRFTKETIWEFPISSIDMWGALLPIGAANYFRQLPRGLIEKGVAHWDRTYQAPFTMYFHTWELDPDQPQIDAATRLDRIRLYRNLDTMPEVLRHYFRRYQFTGIAGYLGIGAEEMALSPARQREIAASASAAPIAVATRPRPTDTERVTLVVPCYNEERSLPYLANTLRGVESSLGGDYPLDLIFVDDCSIDSTQAELQRMFGDRPNCTIIRHDRNRGVAASIRTGIEAARTEIVASIDCDCSYDPHELGRMFPLMTAEVDLVTASPYHPSGGVRNVPRWRLALSQSASALYRVVLHQNLATYTSCFRVYRRSAALAVSVHREGFLGVAEMLGRLDLAGYRIVEYPTVLSVRVLGRSKMKVLRTMMGHMALLAQLAAVRLFGGGRPGRAAVAAHDDLPPPRS